MGLNNLYFPGRNLFFHREKSKLTVSSAFDFLVTKSADFEKGKQRGFYFC